MIRVTDRSRMALAISGPVSDRGSTIGKPSASGASMPKTKG
jgi:hypothetical protein